MKIVQSLWSKPSMKKGATNPSDRNKGGWVDKKYNYMSWALSCLQFRKFYDEVELVTDAQGAALLVDALALPYTSVRVVLDELNDYHPDLWALGKVYAYGIQDQPFIHADGDIFLYEPFDAAFTGSALLAQNIEEGFDYYHSLFASVGQSFDYVPDTLYASIQRNRQIIAVNAGLLGGNDTAFFKEYRRQAFEFVDRNEAYLSRVNIGMFNTIFEQFLFFALAEEKGSAISYYTTGINHAFDGLADFTGLPHRTRYIHTVGMYKRMRYIGDLLAYRLRTDYPDYYYRILNLIRTNQA